MSTTAGRASAPSVRDEDRQARVRALTTYDPHNFSLDQIKLIKDTVARGATDDELRLFVAVCGQTGLNPFARQIHFVKRWDSALGREVGTFQTGIDGYRLIAQRTGAYLGQTETKWCGADAAWKDVWLSDDPPAAAKVGVLRRGFDKPVWGVARWKSYHQTRKDGAPNSMWARYDAEQLAKCAEALALRKAFPQELSGIYAEEEMEHAGRGVPMPELGGEAAVTLDDLSGARAVESEPEAPPRPTPTAPTAPATVIAAPGKPSDEWGDFLALMGEALAGGIEIAKETPKDSGRWYLINAECAESLGYARGVKLCENGEPDPVVVGRVTAWIKARL